MTTSRAAGRLPLLVRGVVLSWAFLGLAASCAAWAQDSEGTAAGLSPGPAAAATASVVPPAAAPAEPEAEGWMDRVDAFFGTWVVGPLATVLFFDFGTPRWLGVSVPFVVLWLLFGAVFFTVRMGFINVRGFWHAIRLTRGDYDKPGETGEVSHFQALASALSATVGLGNIAGVAIAVGTGGPGAVFWLILAGLLGMSSKFTECTLGQMYRKVDRDGTVSGGAMHYLRDGLAELGLPRLGVVLSVVFTVMCMGGSFGGGCVFQVSQSLNAVRAQVPLIDEMPWIYGLVMVFLAGIVVIGGIRRIAATAEKIVPLMCGIYVARQPLHLIRQLPYDSARVRVDPPTGVHPGGRIRRVPWRDGDRDQAGGVLE